MGWPPQKTVLKQQALAVPLFRTKKNILCDKLEQTVVETITEQNFCSCSQVQKYAEYCTVQTQCFYYYLLSPTRTLFYMFRPRALLLLLKLLHCHLNLVACGTHCYFQ